MMFAHPSYTHTVGAELVEAPSFFCAPISKAEQRFDRLSANGAFSGNGGRA